jgi:alanine racemase
MTLSRRAFLERSAAFVPAAALAPAAALTSGTTPAERVASGDGLDPWLEIDPGALEANAREVARVAGGRPVLAVVKNNAYGLGLEQAGPILDRCAEVRALAVVKVDEAIRLREAGARKPILFLGLATDAEAEELVRREVRLAPFQEGEDRRLAGIARRVAAPVRVHLYLDTGMSRLGMPWHRALPWMEAVAGATGVRVEGTFQTFAESREHDPDQLARFRETLEAARRRGVDPGAAHAASSNAVTFFPEAHLDMVRPGLMLYGAQVAGGREEGAASLRPAFRLKARVVRLQELRPGDAVSYGRSYVAERPTWIATLPVGHADGYPRQAVDGCRVLIGERLYPVIGAVSASHTIVEVGETRTIEVGDVATLVGPDRPEIHPNTVSEHTGRSVYDILMHLSPELPKRVGER